MRASESPRSESLDGEGGGGELRFNKAARFVVGELTDLKSLILTEKCKRPIELDKYEKWGAGPGGRHGKLGAAAVLA